MSPGRAGSKNYNFASFFQEGRVFFSEEKAAPARREAKDFYFMRQVDRAFPLRGVFLSG
jgi:hypothetical protein